MLQLHKVKSKSDEKQKMTGISTRFWSLVDFFFGSVRSPLVTQPRDNNKIQQQSDRVE